MEPINKKSVYYVAKKEFLDNIRNKWIIILTLLLFLLVILFSYVAGANGRLADPQTTAIRLIALSSIIVPLIAIILGFSTISGEAESGSFSVVLSYPVTRLEVLLGKFVGLGSVIVTTVLAGFGIGGIIIIATTSGEYWLGFLIFIVLTILLGLIYLSLSICISSYFKRRITSIGGGLFVFFWGQILGFIFLGILYATGYQIADLAKGNIPSWYWIENFFSPTDLNQVAVLRGFGQNNINLGEVGAGLRNTMALPDFLSAANVMVVILLWIILPLVIAYFLFKRRDI